MKSNRVWPQVLCITVGIALASWALVMDRAGLAQPTPEGKKQQAQVGTLEDARLKGFEGVDFSYDVFGAPPGVAGRVAIFVEVVIPFAIVGHVVSFVKNVRLWLRVWLAVK